MQKTFRLLLAALLPLGACNTDEDLIGSESQPNAFTVVEWTPAPGQFIGENDYAGPDGVVTAASAAAWAQKRLEAHQYVSLGGFGGSITVRFAHPIAAGSSGYDFAIRGNAIDTSNEPGIVWVMPDRNGNGRPDDTWYELRGSETGKTTTLADYEVTYYRPDAPQSDVRWTDNRGGEGRIEYLPHHHRQNSYYPAWIEADRYTLKGTRLEAHNRYDEGKKQWVNYPYDWGYVDNAGSDLIDGIAVGFRIANAIDALGAPVRLESIDFIRVQTGVNFQSAGNIGEVSTEVCSFEDLTRH